MKLTKAYGYLENELNFIEERLNNIIQAKHPILRQTSTTLLQAGGKRIRPVFVLLCSQFGDYNKEHARTVAVSLELIHMATLVHDDVVDDSILRRGKPTIKHQFDNKVAMYTGDYMLARAIENIATIKHGHIHRLLSKTIVELCIGEIEQIKDKHNFDQHLRQYLRRIKRKTALLIATSCKLGAVAANVEENIARKLFKYGYYIGMSFQIIDDILDFISSEEVLGKPIGSDLLQGNITLPVLYAMEDPIFKKRIKNLFKESPTIVNDQKKELIKDIKHSPGIKKSYKLSNMYLEKALKVLSEIPDSDTKRTLQEIALSIGQRNF